MIAFLFVLFSFLLTGYASRKNDAEICSIIMYVMLMGKQLFSSTLRTHGRINSTHASLHISITFPNWHSTSCSISCNATHTSVTLSQNSNATHDSPSVTMPPRTHCCNNRGNKTHGLSNFTVNTVILSQISQVARR